MLPFEFACETLYLIDSVFYERLPPGRFTRYPIQCNFRVRLENCFMRCYLHSVLNVVEESGAKRTCQKFKPGQRDVSDRCNTVVVEYKLNTESICIEFCTYVNDGTVGASAGVNKNV